VSEIFQYVSGHSKFSAAIFAHQEHGYQNLEEEEIKDQTESSPQSFRLLQSTSISWLSYEKRS
jgi:hypothetical protein